ncbi:MAG: 50S ribosomal protein L25/general stress protein Ctc [Eubacteriales bacterium]|nr:50S ribosomal protein L25/general stress protein Ctc [Eubacteriales bacterium]
MNTIKVDKRDFTRKPKQLRRSGIVPGNVFGGTLETPVSLQMPEATASRLFRDLREGSRLQLDLEGQILPVQIKEKSINTLNGEILHISFQALKADQKVNSVIHILLENAEKLTKPVEKMLMEIPYASLPGDMIDTITIDMDGMAVGTILTVGDIPELKSDRLEVKVDPDEIVLRISDKTAGPAPVAEETVEEA